MKITVNDKSYDVAENATVGTVMEILNMEPKGLAVALNGKLVPVDKWKECCLSECDKIIIIKAFYGG